MNLKLNKSPSLSNSGASETIKKMNESIRVKTGEITKLKTKNKQLAEELAHLQNNVNGKSSKEDESEKCSKKTFTLGHQFWKTAEKLGKTNVSILK